MAISGILAWEQSAQVLLSVTHGLYDAGQVTSPLWAPAPFSALMWGFGLMISSAPSC